eukprot:scaffold28052_cov34-Prasinocladus_malaysianus.AAC.1
MLRLPLSYLSVFVPAIEPQSHKTRHQQHKRSQRHHPPHQHLWAHIAKHAAFYRWLLLIITQMVT